MRVTRVYVDRPLEPGRTHAVEGSAAAHITRVLRLRAGDMLTLFDGRGGEHAARITACRKDAVHIDLLEHRTIERESPLDLTLIQGVSRGERMDWVVQKATELGVARILPVVTERSVVRLDEQQAGRKLRHWRAIAVAACEQCGRNRVPDVSAPLPLPDALRSCAPDSARVLLSPGGHRTVRDLERRPKVAVLAGPEGGLSEAEEEAAVASGFQPVQLGPRILRTETAAVAALTALQYEFGDL